MHTPLHAVVQHEESNLRAELVPVVDFVAHVQH